MSDPRPNESTLRQTPWNKGKLTGPKPPLRAKDVWTIRSRLHFEGEVRDLALENGGAIIGCRGPSRW